MLVETQKQRRKRLSEDERTKVFGLAVLGKLHKEYQNLADDNQKKIRKQVRKLFEDLVSQTVGGQMIASDDRQSNS